MRVLHLIHNLEIGGAQVLLRQIAAGQQGSAVEPVVAAWRHAGPLVRELAEAGVTVHVCAPPVAGSPWRTARWLSGLVARYRPQVIHAHMPDSAFWAGLLSVRHGVPAVVSYYSSRILFHTIDPGSLYGRLRFAILRWGARRAAANVACSHSVVASVQADVGLAADAIDVVFNGVAAPDGAAMQAAQAARAAARAAGRAPRVLAVGRLFEIKGQDQLVRCARRLRERVPDARIVIVGEGPCLAAWRALADELGVTGTVEFTGRVADPAEYLRAADVYVSPSRYEGLSLGLLEAMGWGVPVVASRVEGNVDLIRDGIDGVFFPYGDSDALADAITAVLADVGAARARVHRARPHGRALQRGGHVPRLRRHL
ncbi:MAG: glycosyltransferase [Gammaproteobacteria bacterium]